MKKSFADTLPLNNEPEASKQQTLRRICPRLCVKDEHCTGAMPRRMHSRSACPSINFRVNANCNVQGTGFAHLKLPIAVVL